MGGVLDNEDGEVVEEGEADEHQQGIDDGRGTCGKVGVQTRDG